eukprot:CAMPEP_0178654548 /NCGR_PEP_ID=MMETSP0698-20121128/23811_1 /TAXON_ID=265572 /ORGANISM="Extubocellulus spinifer, Strain CCMP396" /LENGTH=693 /DNA_ID=CAMNT_0020296467 /DNA_START=99 /DNA_END=2180 /DNA_ORIENTATION=+
MAALSATTTTSSATGRSSSSSSSSSSNIRSPDYLGGHAGLVAVVVTCLVVAAVASSSINTSSRFPSVSAFAPTVSGGTCRGARNPFRLGACMFGGSGRQSAATTTTTTTTTALFATNQQPPPSKVVDLDDPTPETEPYAPPVVSPESLSSHFGYNETDHPVPHQPWRRGRLNGCDDPVDAQWRLEAEYIVETAAGTVGAYVEDVTWYATFVVVALNPNLDAVLIDNPDGPYLGESPGISVDSTNAKTNVWTDGPDDDDDPAGREMGTFAGEESARGDGEDWDDDDDEEEDDDEDNYDTEEDGNDDDDDGEQSRRRRTRPTRADAVYAYQKEKEASRAERSSTERRRILPGLVEPKDLTEDFKAGYDVFTKDIADLEKVLENKYGYSLRPLSYSDDDDDDDDDDANGRTKRGQEPQYITPDDLYGALKLCNIEWGMEESKLRSFFSYILEKFDVIKQSKDVPRTQNNKRVRADGISESYANKLSIVGKSILDALGESDVDNRLDVLDRHEVILTSSNFDPRIVETQSQFDSARGKDVYVHTRDPWDSNRVLKGKLVDRNALDIILNQGGRMVTIPNSMTDVVKLPDTRKRERRALEGIVEALEEEEEEEGGGGGGGAAEMNEVDMDYEEDDVEEYEEYEEEELLDDDDDDEEEDATEWDDGVDVVQEEEVDDDDEEEDVDDDDDDVIEEELDEE